MLQRRLHVRGAADRAEGFKRAGTADGAELTKAIRGSNITEHAMIGGPISFDAKGQNDNIASAMVQNRNRTPTVVMPAENATMAPVFPIPPWQGRS
jgi:branched-chain amino acid transport system substrate-binding protein